jgi:hypothetical protein
VYSSAELRLIVSPSRTYAALAQSRRRPGPLGALRRPTLVALVLGAAMAISATRHAPPRLVLSTTMCWVVVVVLQLAIALPLIAGPARRTVGVPRAIDLFFASHAPWSLWLLAFVAWAPLPGVRGLTPILLAALIPIALTPWMLDAFFREVLKLDPRVALVRTMMHQAITWTLLVALFGAAVALTPRGLAWIGR